jgi:uncharacterized protein with FMN-binding domain
MLQEVFMHVTNRVDFGHLVSADNFDTSRINSEIYQIFDNRWDWEQRYIHDNYTNNFDPNNTIAQVTVNISAHRLAFLNFPSLFMLGIIKWAHIFSTDF